MRPAMILVVMLAACQVLASCDANPFGNSELHPSFREPELWVRVAFSNECPIQVYRTTERRTDSGAVSDGEWNWVYHGRETFNSYHVGDGDTVVYSVPATGWSRVVSLDPDDGNQTVYLALSGDDCPTTAPPSWWPSP